MGKAGLAQGQVWWTNFHAPLGRRPALILTRTPILPRLNSVTIATITRTTRGIPTEVPLSPAEDGVPAACVVSLDAIVTVQQAMLDRQITTVSAARMTQIFRAVRYAFAMPPDPARP